MGVRKKFHCKKWINVDIKFKYFLYDLEPLYHDLDPTKETQDSGQLHHARDNNGRQVSGRTGEDEPNRIYSVLEDENGSKNYDRQVPGGTGNDNPDRVYSILEQENTPKNYDREMPGGTGNDNSDTVYSVLENGNADSDNT